MGDVRMRYHDADCEHCAELGRNAQLLEPVKGFGSQGTTPTIPEELHSISQELVRAYERATGKPLDVEVRLYYQGQEFVYTMSEERARTLFLFKLGWDWST